MNQSICPKEQLHLLMNDQLEPKEATQVLDHLNGCTSCQEELQSISAEETWWNRAKRCLVHAETDAEGRLPDSSPTSCSIDTLLFHGDTVGGESDPSHGVLDLLDPPMHPEMLGQLDEFEIEKKIGQGGMGIVFRGFDRSLNRPVAIKIMAPHLGINDVARQRFEREAKAAAAVVHPNVVPIYRVSTADKKRPYIAMALADGASLQEHVAENGPMDVKDIVRVGIQIAGGLSEAHKQGLIHRDIKPANVLFEKDVSRILITDFGLARAADDVMMTQSGCLAGTPSYMSPEQVTGKKLDARSDLFSLGSVLYFLATGREPFRAEGTFAVINRVAQATPKSPRSINIDIPEVLNRIIERLLEKDSDDRIESAAKLEEILTQVLAYLQEPTQHQLPEVKATISERRITRRRIAIGALVAAALAACLLPLSGFWGPNSPSPNLDHANRIPNQSGQVPPAVPQAQDEGEQNGNPQTKQNESETNVSNGEVPLEQQNDEAEGDQGKSDVEEEPIDARTARLIEKTLEGLKSNCRSQSNLRLSEIQNYLELPDSAILKARVLIKGVVDKSVRRLEDRVTLDLTSYSEDHRLAEVATFAVNGEIYWFEPTKNEGEDKPAQADVEIFANLVNNSLVVEHGMGRRVYSLGMRSNRVERMDFWGAGLKNLDQEDIRRYEQFEKERSHKATVRGLMIVITHKLNLNPDQAKQFEALIEDKVFGARGSLNSIFDQLINNQEVLKLEPEFLNKTQLAKWRLMKSSEQNIIWD